MSKELHATYQCSEGPVLLSVLIGNGQFGGSAVFVGESSNPVAVDNQIVQLNVGNGAELVGSEVFVKSIVSDTNDMTNKMIVRYILEGGPTKSMFQLTDEVDEDGESSTFRATFQFELA